MNPQTPRHRGAQPGNKNASKPESQRANTLLQCRVKASEKALWIKAAKLEGLTLSKWIAKWLAVGAEQGTEKPE